MHREKAGVVVSVNGSDNMTTFLFLSMYTCKHISILYIYYILYNMCVIYLFILRFWGWNPGLCLEQASALP
jgi:hypothetical protein